MWTGLKKLFGDDCFVYQFVETKQKSDKKQNVYAFKKEPLLPGIKSIL